MPLWVRAAEFLGAIMSEVRLFVAIANLDNVQQDLRASRYRLRAAARRIGPQPCTWAILLGVPSSALAVICVTYRSSDLLPEYAAALMTAIDGLEARVVVVDSSSPDQTKIEAARVLPMADVLVMDSNRGFAAGVNAAV